MDEKILSILGNSMVQKWLSKLFNGYVNTYKKSMVLFKSTWVFSRKRRVFKTFLQSLCGMVAEICLFIILSAFLYGFLMSDKADSGIALFQTLLQNQESRFLYYISAVILSVAILIMGKLDIGKKVADVRNAGIFQDKKSARSFSIPIWICAVLKGFCCWGTVFIVCYSAMQESVDEDVTIKLWCVGISCILFIGIILIVILYFIQVKGLGKICSVTLEYCELEEAVTIYKKENLEKKETMYRTVNLLTEDLVIGYVDNDIYIVPKDIEELEKKGWERYTKEEIYCLKLGNDEKKEVVYVKFIDNEWKRWNI